MPLGCGSPFPDHTLPDPSGAYHALSTAWSSGPALVLFGHGDCRTTREALPYLDRIQRHCPASAGVLAVLQDTAVAARALSTELGLALPLRLDGDPYRAAAGVRLTVVPTLFLVEQGGRVAGVSEALRRADVVAFAQRLGVAMPLLDHADPLPELRPG